MTPPMSGAELKTVLGGLGLLPSWFAVQMGVTMRTVLRWFDSDVVPVKAAVEAVSLRDMTAHEVRELAAIEAGRYGLVTLRTYRTDADWLLLRDPPLPASWHRVLMFRVAEQLRGQGRPVTVVYEDSG